MPDLSRLFMDPFSLPLPADRQMLATLFVKYEQEARKSLQRTEYLILVRHRIIIELYADDEDEEELLTDLEEWAQKRVLCAQVIDRLTDFLGQVKCLDSIFASILKLTITLCALNGQELPSSSKDSDVMHYYAYVVANLKREDVKTCFDYFFDFALSSWKSAIDILESLPVLSSTIIFSATDHLESTRPACFLEAYVEVMAAAADYHKWIYNVMTDGINLDFATHARKIDLMISDIQMQRRYLSRWGNYARVSNAALNRVLDGYREKCLIEGLPMTKMWRGQLSQDFESLFLEDLNDEEEPNRAE